MTQNSLDKQNTWIKIGEGSYHKTYRSLTRLHFLNFFGYVVKKQPKDPYDTMSHVDRGVRKSHEIYPEMPVQVEKPQSYSIRLERPPLNRMRAELNVIYLFEAFNKELGIFLCSTGGPPISFITTPENDIIPAEAKNFMLNIACRRAPLTPKATKSILHVLRLDKHFFYMPFFNSPKPSDEEIALETLNIYRNSRNIIADAGGVDNFKKRGHQAICIDYDCAIRRGSFDSDTFMSSEHTQAEFRNYWNDLDRRNINIKTNALVRTLFYLEQHLSNEQISNDFLNMEVIEKLHRLRELNHSLTLEDIALIQRIIEVFPNHHLYNESFTPEVLAQLHLLQETPDFVSSIANVLILNQPIHEDLITELSSSDSIVDINESIFSSPEI